MREQKAVLDTHADRGLDFGVVPGVALPAVSLPRIRRLVFRWVGFHFAVRLSPTRACREPQG